MPPAPKPPESFTRLSNFAQKIMAVPKAEVEELIERDKKARARKKRQRTQAG